MNIKFLYLPSSLLLTALLNSILLASKGGVSANKSSLPSSPPLYMTLVGVHPSHLDTGLTCNSPAFLLSPEIPC
eukprot:2108679-Karenia_brevis.AAC.1